MVRAVVERVVALGFEVRVELTDAATKVPFIAQITRGDAEALKLAEGDTVYVRATRVPPLADVEPAPPRDLLARSASRRIGSSSAPRQRDLAVGQAAAIRAAASAASTRSSTVAATNRCAPSGSAIAMPFRAA